MPAVRYRDLADRRNGETPDSILRPGCAREVQRERSADRCDIHANAHVVRTFCEFSEGSVPTHGLRRS
jgi:hypothetical protein